MVTTKRARGGQGIRENSNRGRDRLEGLVPVVEDWHAKMCLICVSILNTLYLFHAFTLISFFNLQVIWKRLYKCSSSRRSCNTLPNEKFD